MAYLLDPPNAKRAVKVVKTSVSSYQNMNSNYVNVEGGTVDYTPPSDVNYVVYEFHSGFSYEGSTHSSGNFKLLYGSDINNLVSIATNDVNFVTTHGEDGASGSYKLRDYFEKSLFFVIPAWTGQKTLVLQGRGKANNMWEGYYVNGSTWGGYTVDPHVIVYSY